MVPHFEAAALEARARGCPLTCRGAKVGKHPILPREEPHALRSEEFGSFNIAGFVGGSTDDRNTSNQRAVRIDLGIRASFSDERRPQRPCAPPPFSETPSPLQNVQADFHFSPARGRRAVTWRVESLGD